MTTKKPVYVTKAFLPPFEEYVDGLKQIWDSAILTNQGPIHNRLIEELKTYLKVQKVSLLVNGHQALEIALRALHLEGEVITTPYSFASTTHAIVECGLTPVFCDIRLDDYNIDENKIEALITEKTTAIMPVHVYGNPCNIDAINSIAREHGLKVLYDAAHTFGVEVNGAGIGSFGDVSMFSFHATKVFNTIEGGALVFSDPAFERDVNLLKNFGIAGPEDVLCVGTNAKMNEFQALMGVLNLQYVENEIAMRKRVVEKYRELLACVPGIRVLEDKPGIKSNYAYFPVLVDETRYGMNRDALFNMLAAHNIFARKYFFPMIPDYACYRDRFPADNLPVSRYVSDRIMTLPIWGTLPIETVEEICQIVLEGYQQQRKGRDVSL